MSPTSSQVNGTQLSTSALPATNTLRSNYGSLTHQPAAAVVVHSKTSSNRASPASSLKLRQEGTSVGIGAGTGTGARAKAMSHRSVQITVPEDIENNEYGQINDDTSSISSRSSYSTYSSSVGSLEGLDHCHKGNGDGHHYREESEEPSSRRMFWTYVFLTPILLSILILFAILLQFLPASTSEGNQYIIHWDRFRQGVIGWIISFAIRRPLFALFSKFFSTSSTHQHYPYNYYYRHHRNSNINHAELDLYLCEWSTLLSAGVLEEIIRLAVIVYLSISADFGAVYWVGLGWAGVETIYYIGQSLVYTWWFSDDEYYRTVTITTVPTVMTSLLASTNAPGEPSTFSSDTQIPTSSRSRSIYTNGNNGEHSSTSIKNKLNNGDNQEHDEIVPSREARHLLGLDRPWWSLMGRTSSMMVHIGLCCWLGHSGWRLLLPAAAIHGTLNVIWGILMPEQWSVPATSYGTWIAALGVFLIGLALYGKIV